MNQTFCESMESPIRRGIKTVGIGKKGSKFLPSDLVGEIIRDLKGGKVSAAAKGAFFAALVLKGVSEEERALEEALGPGALQNPQKLAELLSPDSPGFVQEICGRILQGQTLDTPTARRLGDFLFSSEAGDGGRGLVASALRVRYETPEEYEGLLSSMAATIEEPFRERVPEGPAIVQLAEPFDGVDQSYMITPLLADSLGQDNYRVVSLVGRNSGPKEGYNLLDLAKALPARFLKKNQDLHGEAPPFGWYIHQEDLSRAVDRWVEIRRQTIKRPFLSTLEKFLNPVKADVIITSAFHPPYTEKMITTAERAGFPAAIVVRNGIEGTLAFGLKRAVKIMCSVRQEGGAYLRQEFEFDPERYLGFSVPFEEKLEAPSLLENVRLITMFKAQGATDCELFDLRLQVTRAGLQQALDWVRCKKAPFPSTP